MLDKSAETILDLDGLRRKGIKFSRVHLHRLAVAGKFPRPIKVGSNTNGWVESEIDAYIKKRIAERDAAGGDGETKAA